MFFYKRENKALIYFPLVPGKNNNVHYFGVLFKKVEHSYFVNAEPEVPVGQTKIEKQKRTQCVGLKLVGKIWTGKEKVIKVQDGHF